MTSIGVVGNGPATRKQTYSYLQDFVAQFDEPPRFVLPGTPRTFTDAVRFVADWAADTGRDVDIIIDDTGQDPYLAEFEGIGVARNADPESAVAVGVDHLWVALHPEGEKNAALNDLAEAALRRGVRVYDLSDALFELHLDEGDAPDEAQANLPEPSTSEPLEDARGSMTTVPPGPDVPPSGLTEAKVRQIVREEIQAFWDRIPSVI